jgi:octaprenyl-diphosphate synthase
MTLPLICAFAKSSAAEQDEVSRIVEAEELSAEDLNYVCALIDRHGGIAYTRQRAADRVMLAKQQLQIFPDCEARQALFDLADYVVTRNK